MQGDAIAAPPQRIVVSTLTTAQDPLPASLTAEARGRTLKFAICMKMPEVVPLERETSNTLFEVFEDWNHQIRNTGFVEFEKNIQFN